MRESWHPLASHWAEAGCPECFSRSRSSCVFFFDASACRMPWKITITVSGEIRIAIPCCSRTKNLVAANFQCYSMQMMHVCWSLELPEIARELEQLSSSFNGSTLLQYLPRCHQRHGPLATIRSALANALPSAACACADVVSITPAENRMFTTCSCSCPQSPGESSSYADTTLQRFAAS